MANVGNDYGAQGGLARIEIRTSTVALGKRHAYFIFVKEDGSEYVVRAGPSQKSEFSNSGEKIDNAVSQVFGQGDASKFGSVYFEAAPYRAEHYYHVEGSGWTLKELVPPGSRIVPDPKRDYESILPSPDWPGRGEVHESRVIWQGTDNDLIDKYKLLINYGDQVNQAGFEYNALNNNSNTFVGVGCKVIDVPCSLPIGADGKEVSAPGFDAVFGQNADAFGFKSGITFDGKFWRDASGDVMLPPGFPAPDTPPQYDESFDPADPQYQEDWTGGIAGQGDNSPSPYITSPSNASGSEPPASPAPTPLEREIGRVTDRIGDHGRAEPSPTTEEPGLTLAANTHTDGSPTATDASGASPEPAAASPPTDGTPAELSLNHLDAAQGFQSALSFIQALEQGNELSAALSGVSMLNAFAKASGITDPSNLPFSQTTTSSLGAISAAFNLRDALKADDNLAALAAGTNLSSQATFVYASYAESAAAEALAKNLGTAAGVLGIANSLKHGDEAGATASALMLASQLSWIGPWGTAVGLAVGIAQALFGSKKREPDIEGQASIEWTGEGNLTVTTHLDQRGGGAPATSMLRSVLDSLNGYLSSQIDPHGDPQFALIPQRLARVGFHQGKNGPPEFILYTLNDNGSYSRRLYNGQGQRLGLNGEVESTFADRIEARAARQGRRGSSFAEDFLNEVMSQNAIVPTWEVDTIYRCRHSNAEIPLAA